MAATSVKIHGLRELNRALGKVSKDLQKEVRDALKEAGEPVRQQAEQFAGERISRIGPTWGRMKIGSRSKGVYLAPAARRRGGSPRPNFGGLLIGKAMIPAVVEKQPETIAAIEDALENLTRKEGF